MALAQAGYTTYGKVVSTPPTYSAGTYQPLTMDTAGGLKVNPGSGTFTAGAAVNTVPPSFSAGTVQPLQQDTSGRLFTDSYQGGTWTVKIDQTNSGVSNYVTGLVTTKPATFTALGCQQITSLGTAAAWSSVPAGATLVSLTVESQPVRMRDDGTAPTGSVGLLLPVGGPWPYSGPLAAMQFIQTTASATIDGCFYR